MKMIQIKFRNPNNISKPVKWKTFPQRAQMKSNITAHEFGRHYSKHFQSK